MRHTWGEERVFFFDGEGIQRSLPVGWTDAQAQDAFVVMAAGRSPFRVEDLLELAGLIEQARAAHPAGPSVRGIPPHV